jgi:hypothetical protein
MKTRVKTICSAIALVAWIILVAYRSGLVSSRECAIDTQCSLKAEVVSLFALLFALLVFLYISLELLITPKSSVPFILQNALSRNKLSSSSYQVAGILGVMLVLPMLYLTITKILGFRP